MNNIKVGDLVMVRYNKRAKWKEGKVWEIDNNRTLPYGIDELVTESAHGQKGMWLHSFRVKSENIKPCKP